VIKPEHLQIVKEMNLETEIGERQKLSLSDYEELHENKLEPNQSLLHAKKEFVLEHVENISSEKRGERRYAFIE
jgi:hydroxymethylglutaryl-CoA synthase